MRDSGSLPSGLPPAPQPQPQRNRGYSLRRTLFARTIHNPKPTEPAAADEEEEGQHELSGVDVCPPSSEPSEPSQSQSSPANVEQPEKAGVPGSLNGKHEEGEHANVDTTTTSPFGRGFAATKYHEIRRRIKFWEKEVLTSKDGRRIDVDASREHALIDERTGTPYIGNGIRSSRYTLWNFLPRQIIFQFSKLANFYFLIISVMSLIPGLSTTGESTNIAPLMVFVALSMGKEGYDDLRRYRMDEAENNKFVSVLVDKEKAKKRNQITKATILLRRLDNLVMKLLRKKAIVHNDEPEISEDSEDSSPWTKCKWTGVEVGDIVKLHRDESVPADIVLLHSDGLNGIAYIDTMDLDGETNLKSKSAPRILSKQCETVENLITCHAQIAVEDPNPDLHSFDGRFSIEGGETLPLSLNEVVFRGSTLRNTSQVYGIVINTGEECKIRMNANKDPRIKSPEIQKISNRIVVMLILFVILLTAFLTMAYRLWIDEVESKSWYLDNASVKFQFIFFGNIVLLNTLIPLSLYVSLEIVKIGQLYLLGDIEMYDEETNTPMEAHTTTILENLGQVDYIFTDKTGTLTENIMRFRKLSVAGTAWLHDFDVPNGNGAILSESVSREVKQSNKGKEATNRPSGLGPRMPSMATLEVSNSLTPAKSRNDRPSPLRRTSTTSLWKSDARPNTSLPEFRTEELLRYMRNNPRSAFTKKAKFFLLSIAICHTCLPETDDEGNITFQAASPDELALVRAAQDLGYILIERSAGSMKIKFTDDATEEEYQILDVIEFSSKRKRMSIIVRFPNGSLCIFCKGADSALQPLLKLAGLAGQKAAEVNRRAMQRKNLEAEEALYRMSEDNLSPTFTRDSLTLSRTSTNKRSLYGRPSFNQSRPSFSQNRPSFTQMRPSFTQTRSSMSITRLQPVRDELDSWLRRREHKVELSADDVSARHSPRASIGGPSFLSATPRASMQQERFAIDDSMVLDDAGVFERCFQHSDDFATEGLRTLLYGYRFLEEEEYTAWKATYMEATTSLADRQKKIEDAGEMIEQRFDLAGATAIEDKLQKAVPDTIDKLRRANIKIWMLTGDKRETAINIAQSARLCKNYSNVVILDHTKIPLEEQISSALLDMTTTTIAHSVIVVDGQTLTHIEASEDLAKLFFDLVVLADTVICCRASPSQKAILVRKVRTRVKGSVTLAIGDGANDIAMIQEAHVGVGISGREGLQAARTSDYSIAQFRFLQRLLFVHGRWNYVRTCKYILGTFWKELFFYVIQMTYQRYNGYTSTSLYDPLSLTVFNTLFTSLCVILLGMFDQDLQAATLLAVPELYTQGQRNEGLNFQKYFGWSVLACVQAMLVFWMMWGLYGMAPLVQDKGLYPVGDLAFSAVIITINVKLLILEVHNKTLIPVIGCIITIAGWFFWNLCLSALGTSIEYGYFMEGAFINHFGNQLLWWACLLIMVSVIIFIEVSVSALRRCYFPTDTDVFQELQNDPIIMRRFEETAAGLNAEMGREQRSSEELKRDVEVQELLDLPPPPKAYRRRPSADVVNSGHATGINAAGDRVD
ncbi:phospholipid-translocating P-type ATPase [Phlyctema vagabunda]|uniref:Phospholipid-transporting ATPase n=1 Tax=Phlyctema vagabunda TaxID=108571 RepID=A0ABR4P8N3_9HELO